jgi:hypothetical protein
MEHLPNDTNVTKHVEIFIKGWVLYNDREIDDKIRCVICAWVLMERWTEEDMQIDGTLRLALANLAELVEKFEELLEHVKDLEEFSLLGE